MAEYINREALIEWLKRIPLKDLSNGLGLCRVIMEDDFKKAIKKMPKSIIADVVEVRHGEWIDLGDGEWKCSLCGGEIVSDSYGDIHPLHDCGWIGCPYCLAKMDGKC